MVDSRSYDAFGLPTAASGPNVGVSQAGFGSGYGYQEDSESGLKLLGHRYYDPGTGRFVTRDPIGSGTNWYRYADNNPLKQADPSGLIAGFLLPKEASFIFSDNGPLPPWNPYHTPYKTAEEAARAALAWAMKDPRTKDGELYGDIIEVLYQGGGFVPTAPKYSSGIPNGTTQSSSGVLPVAGYHTHPFADNPPSNADYNRATDGLRPEYVGDLSGNMWRMDPGPYLGPRFKAPHLQDPYQGPYVHPLNPGWRPRGDGPPSGLE